MRKTLLKKRFTIDQYTTNSGRFFLYDNGVIVGRIIKSGETHALSLHKGHGLEGISAADLSDLICTLRELDSVEPPKSTV